LADFVPRDLPATIHTVNNLNWSKSRAQSHEQIAHNFREYVRTTCDELDISVLALRNNSDTGVIQGEERINHNPHGINHYTHYQAISLESALNPSNGYRTFLREFVGMEAKDITVAFSAYLFYQCIMRTALRVRGNTKQVHVFCLDNKTAVALLEYFSPSDVVEPELSAEMTVHVPMTSAERNKRWRDKQKALRAESEANERTNAALVKTLASSRAEIAIDMSKDLARGAQLHLTNEQKLKNLLDRLKAGS
jgi:hypothetical protein